MASLNRALVRATAVVLFVVLLSGCQVTFRRKPIQPLDNDRNYDIAILPCWDASRQVVADFATGVESEDWEAANDAGMLVTEFAVFSDTGDNDYNHLKRVAFAQGAPFIGGRYQLTVTTRLIRGGRCKVRVVARIEGYMGEEYGYQTLRSNGVLEQEIFDRISSQLGVTPADGTPQ